jgi:hypothetical protein
MSKRYFSKVKVGDKVYGTVFGPGKVTSVLNGDHYYKFEVTFKNGSQVYYTEDGVPNWGNFSEQTLFYREDINNYEVEDFLSFKKIIKLMNKPGFNLEVKVPSGEWKDIHSVDCSYLETILFKNMLFLIREVN